MPFSKLNVRRWWLVGGLIALAGVFAYIGYAQLTKNPPIVDYRAKLKTETVQQDAKQKITAETIITQKMVYLKCGDEEILRARPSENYVGLTLAQLQAAYPGWTIEYFDPAQVRMTLLVDSFCREHANGLYLGIKDGYVAVYYGRPGIKPIVKEVTKISVNRLVAEDIAELEKGIIVNTKEELLRTLEGMQSQ